MHDILLCQCHVIICSRLVFVFIVCLLWCLFLQHIASAVGGINGTGKEMITLMWNKKSDNDRNGCFHHGCHIWIGVQLEFDQLIGEAIRLV